MKKLIQLKNKDLKRLRKIMHDLNEGKCPLLEIEVDFDKVVVDHQHKLKSEEPSECGKGLVRNAIEFRANAMEGKITNNWKRYFGSDPSNHPISLPNFLRRLADYLEAGPIEIEGNLFIHPSESPKVPLLRKSSYNKLKKEFLKSPIKRKFPDYPKSKKITKELLKLYSDYNLEPEFY